MTPKKEQIKYTLEDLNVEAISEVLTHFNIKWDDTETGESRIPTVDEIYAAAEHCMVEAFKSEDKTFRIGGFEAEVIKGIIEVKFVLTRSNPLSKIFG